MREQAVQPFSEALDLSLLLRRTHTWRLWCAIATEYDPPPEQDSFPAVRVSDPPSPTHVC